MRIFLHRVDRQEYTRLGMRISEKEYNHQLRFISQVVEKQIKFNENVSFEFQVCAEHIKTKYEYDNYYAVVDRFEIDVTLRPLSQTCQRQLLCCR